MSAQKVSIDDIVRVGGQYAVTGRYRHPSFASFVTASGHTRGVFDTEKVKETLSAALEFIEGCGKKKQTILFISTRQETVDLIKNTAESMTMPYMLNRWIGGTLSNFKNIRTRVARLGGLIKDRDEGNWAKHTKKERVLLNRELAKLAMKFSGIVPLENLPDAVFILDTRKEKNAVEEAIRMHIPVVGFSNADADIAKIDHPIMANIYSREAVAYILGLVEDAYIAGTKKATVDTDDNDV